MDPIAVHLGPLVLRWYGILVLCGALAGAYIASLEAERRGRDPDHIWNAFLYVLLLGLVGARLYHVISSPQGTNVGLQYYLQNPLKILYVWEGGLGIFGGILGGVLGLWLYCRSAKISFLEMADIAVPGLAIGQAIGRWGNFFNQELYGYPTTMPWGITIDPTFRLEIFRTLPADAHFHPTFLYESLLAFAICFILLWVARRFEYRLKDGDIFLLYLILYPVVRFFTELQRPDAWQILGIPTAQLISIISIIVAGGLLYWRHRNDSSVTGQEQEAGI